MGVSFKVSKTGRWFRPKPLQSESRREQDGMVIDDSGENQRTRGKIESGSRKQAEICQGDEDATGFCDGEVSFTLSLYPDGYTIGKPSEGESGHQNSIEVPKFLHPYDRASETLFSAIESGRLPGDILDDIHCKYINGMVFCEVRDYRKCFSETGGNMPSIDGSPIINKVCLRMSLENVVKDIPLISDSGWTYGDLMEVESRVLKALQPKLSLDPTPMLDRQHDNPIPNKLNFALYTMRRKRNRQVSDVTVASSNNIHGKKVCVDRVPESSRLPDSGSVFQQSAIESLPSQINGPTSMVMQKANSFGSNASGPSSPLMAHPSKYPVGVGSPRIMQDHRSGSVLNTQGASIGQDMMIAYSENVNSGTLPFHVKKDSQEAQSPSLSVQNKRSRVGVDGNQQPHVGSQVEGFHGPDSYLKNPLLQQQSLGRGIQFNNAGMQKYPQQMYDGSLHQESGSIPFNQGMRYGLKEEPVDSERLDKPELGRNKNDMHMLESELNNMDSQQSRLQQRIPQQFMRSSFPQSPWNGQGQLLEGNSRKEDPYQKRKLVQSPRVSAGGLAQSPLSSKSGEFSSGSVGQQVGAAVTSGFVSSQKDRSVVTPVPPIVGTASLTSSANESMQRQHQAQLAAKRRSNSHPKAPAMHVVGSPASVSNTSVPLNVSSPPVGTPFVDPSILERFSKIDLVMSSSFRHRLNRKKNKVDELPMGKSRTFPVQELQRHLSTDSSNEIFKEDSSKVSLSKSLVGGNTNICKARVLTFMQSEHIIQGNNFSFVPKARTRLIMSMKRNDDTVAMHIGDIDEALYWAVEDYLPVLPNMHKADLLAAQYCALMAREGYSLEENYILPKPVPTTNTSNGQPNTPCIPSGNASTEMQQYSEGVSGQPSNDIIKPSNSAGASLNPSNNLQGSRMLPPGNAQGIQFSQGQLQGVSLPSRSQQSDTLPTLLQPQQQQLQNQQPIVPQQLQRSSLMIAANQMPHLNSLGQNLNMQLGSQISNKHSPIQLQLLQHQQQLQPHQQQQIRRKMMMGLGNVGMGNIPNNMVLGNVMGMTGGRVSGGAGISAPMTSIGGIGNRSQNSINMSQNPINMSQNTINMSQNPINMSQNPLNMSQNPLNMSQNPLNMGQNPINMNQASNISNAISQQLRSGLTPTQIMAASMLRMPHNRANVLGTPQSSMSSVTGARPLHPGSADLSMLGTTLNRGNMNPMQRNIGQMAPPKLMSGMNMYMNQPQQPQQQLLLQQLHQQQQQHETTASLQAVVPPQTVSSPSNVGIPQPINQQMQQQQQQASPQQMNQRTPMSPQLSSGAIHTMSAGNPEACPASPQLSSQNLGSANSIGNSPMENQGVNKSNSVNNA